MRILHVGKYGPAAKGGVESFTFDLARRQVQDGHDVSVLCHRENGIGTVEGQRGGVRVVEAGILCKTVFAPIAPMFGVLLKRELDGFRPDVVHFHMPNPAVLFMGRLPENVPLVVHWHADVHGSPNRFLKMAYPVYRVFEQRLLAGADRIVATSPPYLEASAALRKWRDKCQVVPLGVDPDRCRAETRSVPAGPLISSVGRFAYYKGFEHLVRAAALVPEASFVLAGDGPLRHEVEGLVRELGVRDRVTLPGAIPDEQLHALLTESDIFCLPSVDRGEAFGVVLLEAMSHGVPLLSTSIPGSGTSWVNQDGVTGMVVPPGDPERLAAALKSLLNDPERRKRYGQAARERFLAEFTISKTAASLEQVYRQALAAHG